ncbi:hypothetical protein [Mesonia sp. K7]|uniref:hypothetical protein n=1 Tax=Mesonia sp. K7 TaxID=2218606 RepID=UPI0011B627A1|nr:hypothetical protein [Mesonia sp. K7]
MHLLPLKFEAALLQRDFNNIVRNWGNYFNMYAYGKWSQLPLRAMISKFHFLATGDDGALYRNTKLLAQSPYFQKVLESLDCEISEVRLLRWEPFSDKKELSLAEATFFTGNARLYVPIITNSLTKISAFNKTGRMVAGECWLTKCTPEIINQGSTNAVFLTVDVKVSSALNILFDKEEVEKPLNKAPFNSIARS